MENKKNINKSLGRAGLVFLFLILISGIGFVSATNYVTENGITSPSFTSGNITYDSNGISVSGSRTNFKYDVCKSINAAWDKILIPDCKYVCKYNESDCSPYINLSLAEKLDGDTLRLHGKTLGISQTIQGRWGLQIVGDKGIRHSGTDYDTSTRLMWIGAVGGTMINFTGYKSEWGVQDLSLDGNYTAYWGIRKDNTGSGERARHLNIARLYLTHINGSSIDFGLQVDDTQMQDIYCEGGGANSVCLNEPNSEVSIEGGVIADQKKAGIYITRNDSDPIASNGEPRIIKTTWANNWNDVEIYAYNATNPFTAISVSYSWFENTLNNRVQIDNPMTINGFSWNANTFLAKNIFNLTLANVSMTIEDGVSTAGSSPRIYSNPNSNIVLKNAESADQYAIYGSPKVTKIGRGIISVEDDTYPNIATINIGSETTNSQSALNIYRNGSTPTGGAAIVNYKDSAVTKWQAGMHYDTSDNYAIRNKSGDIVFNMQQDGTLYLKTIHTNISWSDIITSTFPLNSPWNFTIIPNSKGISSKSLLVYLDGDELIDKSGNGNNITHANISYNSGRFGNRYYFNGSQNYIDLRTDFFQGSGSRTVSMWITKGVTGGSQTLFSSNNGRGDLYIDSSGYLIAKYFDGGGYHYSTPSYLLTNGNEYYITAMWNDSSVYVYVNGSLVSSASGGTNDYYLGAGTKSVVGASAYNYVNNLNGTIEDFTLYNRSLSADEIKSNYEKNSEFISKDACYLKQSCTWEGNTTIGMICSGNKLLRGVNLTSQQAYCC